MVITFSGRLGDNLLAIKEKLEPFSIKLSIDGDGLAFSANLAREEGLKVIEIVDSVDSWHFLEVKEDKK